LDSSLAPLSLHQTNSVGLETSVTAAGWSLLNKKGSKEKCLEGNTKNQTPYQKKSRGGAAAAAPSWSTLPTTWRVLLYTGNFGKTKWPCGKNTEMEEV
jgi:hypothetical protein